MAIYRTESQAHKLLIKQGNEMNAGFVTGEWALLFQALLGCL